MIGLPRLLPLILLLSACADPTGEDGNPAVTYVHTMDGAPDSLDPAQASSIYADFLVVNLYDTLYRYKYLARPYELAPNLAAAMPEVSADGLELTIRLKRGVHFVDDPAFPGGKGREVTAADVVYSIERHFDPASRAQGAWLWQGRIEGLDAWKSAGADYDMPVDGLRAMDDHTLRIQLTRPYPQFVHTLTQGYAAVVPREAVEAYGRELGSRAVGSGPFALERFDSSRAVLRRNPDFRAEPFDPAAEGFEPSSQAAYGIETLSGQSPPFVDRLVVEFIAEDAARWNAFIGGQTHFIRVPAAQFDRVLAQRDPPAAAPELAEKYHLEMALESGLVYTHFNMADPEIGRHPDPERADRNRALRCAIVKGFDWEERNQRFYSGIARVFPGIIPPTAPEYDASARRDYVTHDPEGARRLLEANGWNDGNLPVLEYGFPASVTERMIFEQFREFMAGIGYPRDKVRPLTFATFGDYVRAYSRRELMLVTSSWTLDYPDAENVMQLFYGPNASPGSNSSNYANPRYDELYERSVPMTSSPERTELYRRMNRMVMDDCATISGLSRTLVYLWDRKAKMLPDRSFTGGYFLRFVGMAGGSG